MQAGAKRLEGLKRFHSLSLYFRKRYGLRVHKISLDAGFTCPNRDGQRGRGGCIYCDEFGSGSGAYFRGQSLKDQVLQSLEYLSRRFKAQRFMVYFQSFSNTYGPVEKLKGLYDSVLLDDRIIGLSVGTRPDCVDEAVVDLLTSYRQRGLEVWLELGLQSIHEVTLRRINRGHGVAEFYRALDLAKKAGLLVCVHVIFGLPGEDYQMMLETIEALSQAPIDGLKFHALYVLKKTPLETLYRRGEYHPLSLGEYVDLVSEALSLLPWSVVIQRLSSDPPRDRLVAPEWTLKKNLILSAIETTLVSRDLWQGKRRGEKWPRKI